MIVCLLYAHLSEHCKFGNLPELHSRFEYGLGPVYGKQKADKEMFAATAGGFPGHLGDAVAELLRRWEPCGRPPTAAAEPEGHWCRESRSATHSVVWLVGRHRFREECSESLRES
jgi:hypothetical protein